jgi:hypothetical protein
MSIKYKHVPNVFYVIYHTPVISVLCYCWHKSTVTKITTLQIYQWQESQNNFLLHFVICSPYQTSRSGQNSECLLLVRTIHKFLFLCDYHYKIKSCKCKQLKQCLSFYYWNFKSNITLLSTRMPVKNIFSQGSVFSLCPTEVIITKCGIFLNGTRTVNIGFSCILAKCTYMGFFRVIRLAKTEFMKQDVRCNIKVLPTCKFAQPPYCN